MASITLRYVPFIPTLLIDRIVNESWILPNAFSECIEMIVLCLAFTLLVGCVTLTCGL